MVHKFCWMSVFLLVFSVGADAADLTSSLEKGTPGIQAAGALTFGPDGVLFIGDSQSAAIFAIDTKDKGPAKGNVALNVAGIDGKIAALLGVSSQDIRINDLVVNPASGKAYLSISRTAGGKTLPVIIRVEAGGKISELPLENISFAVAKLPNAPKPGGTGRRNQRRESITDMAYIEGRLLVAGLSNEEFASKLRAIPFPFVETGNGTSVEIFHGAHGRFETRSPVRTLVPFTIEGEPHLLAAYTCTPLVKFPISDLTAGKKIKGVTIAELGNRNRPLDMVVYQKNGNNYVLLANSSRGVMKITTKGIAKTESITDKISGTAGLSYDTIEELTGVEQLDRLDDGHALLLVASDDGEKSLKTVAFP